MTEYFCPFSAGALAALVESEEEEDDDAALVTRRCVVSLLSYS